MTPDFSKNTIETIAKRAAYKCSNPDCRVNTIGPKPNPSKSTKIGEAAHIYGARLNAKRFNLNMTQITRREITNSIWLCRNCHKLIDTDEEKYSPKLLFLWREKHEEYITSTLGNKTDQILFDELTSSLQNFNEYPSIIKRIVIDKPNGWEYRLTAELMRFMNEPDFRKLRDLRKGLYIKKIENIDSEHAISWIQDRVSEMSKISNPVVELLDSLNKSWGKPGESGNAKEIHHVTKLIKEYLEHVVSFEERIYFVSVPEQYGKLISLLKNLIGSQIEKLSSIPSDLDEILVINESSETNNIGPKIIKKEFVFDTPKNWSKEFAREVKRIKRNQQHFGGSSSGCLLIVCLVIIFTMIFLV